MMRQGHAGVYRNKELGAKRAEGSMNGMGAK